MRDYCLDKDKGGVYWSVTYDGKPEDSTKHTYNQAFAVYALSSYYDASKDKEALDIAYGLYNVIETKCRNEGGYLEAFNYLLESIKVGDSVIHKKYGAGIVKHINKQRLVVDFEGKETEFGLALAIANGIVTSTKDGFGEKQHLYKDVLKKHTAISSQLEYAARELEKYEDYLD